VLDEGGFIALKESARKHRPGRVAVASPGEYLNFQSGILGRHLAGIAHLRSTDYMGAGRPDRGAIGA